VVPNERVNHNQYECSAFFGEWERPNALALVAENAGSYMEQGMILASLLSGCLQSNATVVRRGGSDW
jgi:hypothetical protein